MRDYFLPFAFGQNDGISRIRKKEEQKESKMDQARHPKPVLKKSVLAHP